MSSFLRNNKLVFVGKVTAINGIQQCSEPTLYNMIKMQMENKRAGHMQALLRTVGLSGASDGTQMVM